MPTLAEFNAVRKPFEAQYFPTPNPGPHTQTIMVTSHIWWTEHLALAMLNAGHNVLLHFALYLLYTDDEFWRQFDRCWNMVLHVMWQHKVDLIIGGNATALVVHPKTGELLHQAAKVEGVIRASLVPKGKLKLELRAGGEFALQAEPGSPGGVMRRISSPSSPIRVKCYPLYD